MRLLITFLLCCVAATPASTKYFGGSGTDTATAIATDAQGNIYIAGSTNSVDFPITNGTPHKPRAPLAAISNGAATLLPVSTATSVLAVAGTPDASVLYAFCPGGVYVSSDGGVTWTLRGPSPVKSSINSVSVDVLDPARMYVATSGGLYFTDTGGEQWASISQGLPTNGNGVVSSTWVAISPADHETTYVIGGTPSGLYRTANAGATWTLLNPAYPNQPTGAGYQTDTAALSPDGSSLYLIDMYGNLLKSTDGGTSWQLLGGQLYGASSLVLDPSNASNLYVADYSGIQMSADGGLTFNTLVARASSLPVTSQFALDSATQTLYYGTSSAVTGIPVSGGASPITFNTPSLNWLGSLGGRIYAAYSTPSTAYVTKWDPTGTNLLYSTLFGGSIQDTITAIAIDAQGECTVAGYTNSPDFPATNKFFTGSTSLQQTAFVTRISSDGTHVTYSDLLGQNVLLQGLALDSTGAAYLTGQTRAGVPFPLTPNAYQSARPQTTCNRPAESPFVNTDSMTDAFVTKLSPDGSSLIYSTLLTGSCGSTGFGIAVDAAGEAVVAGSTDSSDFPASTGAYQSSFPGDPAKIAPPNPLESGFVAKLSAAGDHLVGSSYLGGSYQTSAYGVALDSAGNIYLTGGTAKILPGATPGAYQTNVTDTCAYPISIGPSGPYGGAGDAFVLKLDPTLSTAGYLTYLGGGCNDYGTNIALDPSGNAWITGISQSPDFPLRAPYQGGGIGIRFVSEIGAGGSQLLFSSSTDGAALAIDPSGHVNLAGSATNSIPTAVVPVPFPTGTAPAVGSSAEWIQIDPTKTNTVVINKAVPVTSYPPSVLEPFYVGNALVPGELIEITGTHLGPTSATNGQFDSTGHLPFSLAGTTVWFDSIPAPLVSVSDTAITCLAPFEITQLTNLSVEANGTKSNLVAWGVRMSDPQILSVANADGTPNSPMHPAGAGDIIVLYASGLGETTPLSADGLVNAPPLAIPAASVNINLGNQRVTPLFVGAAPGQVAGIVQINLQIPSANLPASPTNIGLNTANAPLYLSQ